MAKTYQKLLLDILYSEELQTCSRETQGLMLSLVRYLASSKKYSEIITGGGDGCDVSDIVYNVLGSGVNTGKSVEELFQHGITTGFPEGIYILSVDIYMLSIMSEMLDGEKSVFGDRLMSSLTNKEVGEHKGENYHKALYTAKEIYDRVYEWMPKNKALTRAKIESWMNIISLMVRKDERDPKEIYDMFQYAHGHIRFWKKTILSPGSLREHYDKILAEKQQTEEQTQDDKRENPTYLTDEEQ